TSSPRGFYYRQRPGGSAASRGDLARPAASAPEPEIYARQRIASAEVGSLSDLAQDDFAASLNQ
ncbi:MAG TPA: hypothetical protein VGC42_21595, partial [Kofleriaceae bacterium]